MEKDKESTEFFGQKRGVIEKVKGIRRKRGRFK